MNPRMLLAECSSVRLVLVAARLVLVPALLSLGPGQGAALLLEGNSESRSTPEPPVGTITDWQVSRSFPAGPIDLETLDYPRFYSIFFAEWEDVTSGPSGLVDVSQLRERNEPDTSCVMARAMFSCDRKQRVRLSFGYSDEVAVFLNRHKLFYGMSANRWRGPSFPGIAALRDAVYLDLEKGLNEIFLILKESSGEWGFACRADRWLDSPAVDHGRLQKAWETQPVFLTSESVLYDPKRDLLYVTSFDNKYKADASQREFTGYISKVRLDGQVEDLKWVTGLHAPCGMGMHGDRLYTVERRNLAEIDATSGRILNRYPIPDCVFPNDVAVDSSGFVYITDTSPPGAETSRIYRFRDGVVETWLETDELSQPNGIYLQGNTLLVGSSGNGRLLAVDVNSKSTTVVTCLGAGVIDGIRPNGDGGYFVSHWEGRVYSVSRSGGVTELMDMTGQFNTADFEYVAQLGLLIIPTFVDNRVVAYKLSR